MSEEDAVTPIIDTLDDENAIPPRPRKLPQQSRSKMLVESVKQACFLILQKEGPRGLTATQISELSGVAMGSIYQYFPNVDAIIATIYEDLIREEIEIAHQRVTGDLMTLSLDDALRYLMKGTLSFHRRMLRLDREFHQKFYKTFDLTRWYNARNNDPLATSSLNRTILEHHAAELNLQDAEMQAFIMGSTQRAAILDAVKYFPEYLESEEFYHHLMRMTYAIIGREYKPE